jgi:hypothetical protein
MSELQNFPFVNQRDDGDANAEFDCVPSSLAAAANYLLGKNAVNDAQMKDEIYGANYVGGTAASEYVDYLSKLGLHLFPLQGSYPSLVKLAHQHLSQGHPVVFTRDDPYAPAHPDWSHVCVWYADTPTSLTAMDPYGGQSITMSDAQWIPHLRFNEIWIVEKEEVVLQISDVQSFFTEQGGIWKCKNGNQIIGAMLDTFRKTPNPLAFIGLPKTNELSVDGHPGCKIQVFERIVLAYDPSHTLDRPPGSGDVYAMHLDTPTSPAVQQILKVLNIQASPSIDVTAINTQISIALGAVSKAQDALNTAQSGLFK